MNLRHLEVFRHVMQTGTVKGAAAVMNVSEAAASKLLSTAQRRMGLQLFERTRGRLVPTPEALRLYQDVDQLWVRVEHIAQLTRSLSLPAGGRLNLAISPSFGVTLVPGVATALLTQVPDLALQVDLLVPHLLTQALVDGVADLGVALNLPAHPSLAVVQTHPCRLVCVMPPAHPLAGRTEIRASDLPGHPVVSFPQALNYGLTDDLLFGRHRDAIVRRLHVRSGQTACWFSQAGAGLAIVDEAAVAGQAFPSLAIRPYRSKARLGIHVLRHRDRPLSRAGELFCTLFARTWRELERPT